jgi:hypothetical protein
MFERMIVLNWLLGFTIFVTVKLFPASLKNNSYDDTYIAIRILINVIFFNDINPSVLALLITFKPMSSLATDAYCNAPIMGR